MKSMTLEVSRASRQVVTATETPLLAVTPIDSPLVDRLAHRLDDESSVTFDYDAGPKWTTWHGELGRECDPFCASDLSSGYAVKLWLEITDGATVLTPKKRELFRTIGILDVADFRKLVGGLVELPAAMPAYPGQRASMITVEPPTPVAGGEQGELGAARAPQRHKTSTERPMSRALRRSADYRAAHLRVRFLRLGFGALTLTECTHGARELRHAGLRVKDAIRYDLNRLLFVDAL